MALMGEIFHFYVRMPIAEARLSYWLDVRLSIRLCHANIFQFPAGVVKQMVLFNILKVLWFLWFL